MTSRQEPEFSTIDVELLPVPKSLITSVSQGAFASSELYNLRLLAEHALLVSGFDELISLSQLQFSPFDYQLRAAQTMLRRFRGRGMLCDEVGLGKTIEAGLVIKEYLARNVVQRVMVVTPAALVEQWREELSAKFGLPGFVTTGDPEFRAAGAEAWERFPLLSLSHQLKATLILDPVGGEQTIRLLNAAPSHSTALVYGSLSGIKNDTAPQILDDPTKHIEGFYMPDWLATKNIVQVLWSLRGVQHLAKKELHTTVQGRFPLTQVQEAVSVYQANPTRGKVLLFSNMK